MRLARPFVMGQQPQVIGQPPGTIQPAHAHAPAGPMTPTGMLATPDRAGSRLSGGAGPIGPAQGERNIRLR
jgi:hypothetical protein